MWVLIRFINGDDLYTLMAIKKAAVLKILFFVLLFVLVLLLAGCALSTVKDINADPSKYLGQKVRVSGEVMIPLDIGSNPIFSLRDDGSTIMVSSEVVPERGTQVVVTGTVVKGLFSGHYIYADSVR